MNEHPYAASEDPFAAPSTPSMNTTAKPAIMRPEPTTPRPNRYQDPAASNDGAEFVPCPCVCNCGNRTDMTYATLASPDSARHLRCKSCGEQLHLGSRWTPERSTGAEIGSADRVATGGRTGNSFVVRAQPVTDPEEDAWNREIEERLANERRDQARDRWLERLPARWRKPYNDGEELAPEVEERLARFQSGQGGHGTSLMCIGTFGGGKTWVAYTYARAAVDRHLLWPQEITIGTEADIMEPLALASPWELTERSQELLKPTMKLLIIDDVGALGTYKNHENRFATWTKVVNWAYEHNRALVLTTNKTLGEGGELEQWIGPTAYERLKHMVGEHQVFRDDNKRAEMTALWEAEYQKVRVAQQGM